MRLIGRALAGMLVILVLLAIAAWGYFLRSLPQTSGSVTIAALDGPVDVVRDGWGVPHIFAASDHDAYVALGYVHAQDRLWQMEWQRRIGAGRLSEVVGADTLSADKFLRTLGMRRAAEAMVGALSNPARDALGAYVAGVNAFLDEGHPLPPEFTLLGVKPERWTIEDSLVWIKMMSWNLAGNYDLELLRTRLIQAVGISGAAALMPGARPGPDVVGAVPLTPTVGAAAENDVASAEQVAVSAASTGDWVGATAVDAVSSDRIDRLLRLGEALQARIGPRGPHIGSNSWVVGGSHTDSGAPILANDPHLGAQIPSHWYLAELNGDTLHVTGATLPGLPLVVIGRNRRVAWGLTNLGADVQDLYVERVKPGDRNAVAVAGGYAPMTVIDSPISVKGLAEPVPWTARSTRHGPVLSDVIDERAAGDVAGGEDNVLALRWTALDPDDTTFDAFLALNHASGWDDFLRAMRRFVTPCQNVVYADVDGHIGYVAPCRIPIRARGDGTLPVPGWDGSSEWQGTIPFDALPHVKDPARGFIVAANQQVVAADYGHFISRDWAQPYRAERIAALLQSPLDAGRTLTAADMVAVQADQTSLYVAEVLPYLRAVDPDGDAARKEAIALLADWDSNMARDSAAAAIAQAWLLHLGRTLLEDDLPGPLLSDYLPNDNLQHQPRRFLADLLTAGQSPWCDDSRTRAPESCDDLARRALDLGLADLRSQLGGPMAGWRWGTVHRVNFRHQPLGEVPVLQRLVNRQIANGGDAFTVDAAPPNARTPYRQDKTPGYRQIVTLGANEADRFSLSTGQSGHPLSRHYDDRIRAHRDVETIPMMLGRANATGDVLELAPAAGVVPLRPKTGDANPAFSPTGAAP